MKQKMKPIIKILILSFFITLFSGCSEDVYEENLSHSKRDYHFKKITFLELKSINNQAFIESSKLKKVLPPDKHNTLNSISNFDIDLQNIQYLKKTNNHETFSLRVLQVPDSRFTQNIIIDCKPNEIPETYLITYYLDKPLRQINNNDDFINSVTSTLTTRIENTANGNTTNSCIEVGYYEEVDACEGELVTPGENPNCFNSDGSRRTVHVFRVIASDCSTGGGVTDFNPLASQWDYNYGSGSNSNQNSIVGGGAGGGTGNLNLYIPNYYTGYDLNDPAVQNMIQINQFIYNLYSSNTEIRSVVESTEWLLAYTNYWLGVNGGLTPENQNALTYAFNNLPNVYYQHYDNEYTPTQISQFHFNAFQLLLKHGEWLSNEDTQTQQNILQNINSIENIEFVDELIDYLISNPAMSWEIVMNNRTSFDTNEGEVDNYNQGGYDTTAYPTFNPQQQVWPSISPVIPQNKFIGWNRRLHPNWHCMDYSKEQLRVMGYQISSYYSTGQTFQIYTTQNGVNNNMLSQGLSYLKYALSNGIPVIVGVDDAPGHTGNIDNSTDHFIVIVGMGTDSNGKYFHFYDNATGDITNGTSPFNKLYYNSSTGLISGTSQAEPYSTGLTYTITMIRKSKPL